MKSSDFALYHRLWNPYLLTEVHVSGLSEVAVWFWLKVLILILLDWAYVEYISILWTFLFLQSCKSDYKCASTDTGASCVPHKGSMGGLGKCRSIFSLQSSARERSKSNHFWLCFFLFFYNSCMKKRFQNDMAINNSTVEVLNEWSWVPTPWKKLQVGDIIRVSELYFYFPCQIAFLYLIRLDHQFLMF